MSVPGHAGTAGLAPLAPQGPAAPPGQGPLRAVLFDMDGLLVDTEPLWFETERAVMTRMGGSWTEQDQAELLGSSLGKAVAYFRARAPRPASPATVGRWITGTMTTLVRQRGVGLLPGAGELLAEVTAAGLPHALVTSAQRQIMTAVLAVTGLSFPVTVCGQDVRRGKPDPEPYLRAASLLGVAPGGCMVLEDSPAGVAAAEAAGCRVIAVPSAPGLRYPDRAGRVTVASLREVSLGRLREIAGTPGPAAS